MSQGIRLRQSLIITCRKDSKNSQQKISKINNHLRRQLVQAWLAGKFRRKCCAPAALPPFPKTKSFPRNKETKLNFFGNFEDKCRLLGHTQDTKSGSSSSVLNEGRGFFVAKRWCHDCLSRSISENHYALFNYTRPSATRVARGPQVQSNAHFVEQGYLSTSDSFAKAA